eukprot:gene49661-60792_t
MPEYKAPLRDMRFVLHELHGSDTLKDMKGLEDITPDLIDAVLEEAGKLVTGVLAPINMSADQEGCTYENGVVRTPKGFKEAYGTYREGGWNGIACDPEWGGQGLPASVTKFIEEMMCSANLAFGLYPGLTHGAYIALKNHASQELKERFLPKMVWFAAAPAVATDVPRALDLALETRSQLRSDASIADNTLTLRGKAPAHVDPSYVNDNAEPVVQDDPA